MLACAIALAQEDGEAWIAELAREAVAQGLPVVSAILQDAKPHCTARRLPDPHVAGHLLASFFDATGTPARSESPRVLADPPPSCDARDVGIPGRWYLVTRHLMEPLLLHPDPVVVRRLLRARSLRLREALIVASRRPTSPSIVREIVASLRWIGRIEVREALVANPFVSTGIALKLLATVSIPAQRGLARGAVHPTLVGVASLLAHVEP
jgi:hypothetical protein